MGDSLGVGAVIHLEPVTLGFLLQEACAALVEVLPSDVGMALACLWRKATASTDVSDFWETMEGQVRW